MREKTFITFLKEKYKALAIPLIMIILGIFIAIKPGSVFGIAVTLIGILLMIAGGVIGFSLLAAFSPMTTIVAILLFLLGVICVINPGGTATFVIRIFGCCILVNSVIRILEVYRLRGKSKGIIAYLANDIITALLGLVLLMVGGGAIDIVFIIIGIIMAILGVSNVITEYRVYRDGCYVSGGGDVVWEEDIR